MGKNDKTDWDQSEIYCLAVWNWIYYRQEVEQTSFAEISL
jgi:hypothetical protein